MASHDCVTPPPLQQAHEQSGLRDIAPIAFRYDRAFDLNKASKWLVMAVLGLSGTVIYLLPFLRELYYEPLQAALGISNMQSGMLTAVFG